MSPILVTEAVDAGQDFSSNSCQIIEGVGDELLHTRTHSSDNIRHNIDTESGGITSFELSVGPNAVDPSDQFIDVIYTFETGNFGFLTEIKVVGEASLQRTRETTCFFRIRQNSGAWTHLGYITSRSDQTITWSTITNPEDYVAVDGKVTLKFHVQSDQLGTTLRVDYLKVSLYRITPSGALSTGAAFYAGSQIGGTNHIDTWYYDNECHVLQTEDNELDVRYSFDAPDDSKNIDTIIVKGRFKISAEYSGDIKLYLCNQRLDQWQELEVWSATTSFCKFQVEHCLHTPDFVDKNTREVTLRWLLSGSSGQLSIDYLRVAVQVSSINRFAVIVVGGSYFTGGDSFIFRSTGNFIRNQLLSVGFSDENIQYLAPFDTNPPNGVDGKSNRTNVFEALAWWKSSVCDGNDIFLVWMGDHGGYPWSEIYDWGYFCVDDNSDGDIDDPTDHIFDWEVQNWLAERPTVGRMIVVLDFCEVGMWIDNLSNTELCSILITSAAGDQYSENDLTRFLIRFSFHFFGNLTLNCIGDAFNNAAQVTESQSINNPPQYPLYDDNGDGVGHGYNIPNGGDGSLAWLTLEI
ncbi:MAG: hypothetical protein ACFFDP_04145 [Promethearchaeota archaeon]